MDESKDQGINWYIKKQEQLKIVPVDLITKKEKIKDGKDQKLIEIAKLSLLMQNICLQEDGIGLSSVQIGIPYKIFIAKDYSKSNQFFTFVDCEYIGLDKKITSIEGCLSLKNKLNKPKRFKLERFEKITVKGYFLNFDNILNLTYFEKEYDGFFSSILQHEIDHHNGILISDIGIEMEIY